MDSSRQGQGSPPYSVFNSLPLSSNSQNMDAWASVDQPSMDQPLPRIQPLKPPWMGPLWKDKILPFVVFQEQKGWRRRTGQETKTKRKTEGEKREWAARAEILRLLACCAKRLVLLVPLWLADLELSAKAWKNFYLGHLCGLISHLTSWQANRAL